MSARRLAPNDALARLAASADPHAPYLAAMLRDGTVAYVENAPATLHLFEAGSALIPVTTPLAAPHPDLSYVVSPHAHFARYSAEELHKLGNPPAEALLRGLVAGVGAGLRAGGIERVAFVNNYLLSTNLWPPLVPRDVHRLRDAVVEAFPDHAVAFRSVDAHGQPGLVGALRAAGFRFVPARQVWYQDVHAAAGLKRVRKDLRRLAGHRWRPVPVTPSEAPRVAELYGMLYLDKYSRLNPQLTVRLFERAIAERWFTFRGFARDGDPANGLDAVLGYVVRTTGAGGERTMTQSVFGFDTRLPLQLGLYSLLSTQVFLEAREHGLAVHRSAGAGAFKAARGAVAVPEFLAVYDRHLQPRRRAAWALLESVGTRVGLPLLLRYGL
ncbi:MAG TPA: hypothetical protein VF594_02570 [Rubricoccaceae bacterium]|jgi:hypothetical protein